MMKKLLLWLVFLSAGTQAQIINFVDANFKNAILNDSNNPNKVHCYDQHGEIISVDQNHD